jgi:hypothetical protein
MGSCEYLGDLEIDEAGNVRVRPVAIAPLPEREYRPMVVPLSVAKRIDAGEAFVTPVIGDSMQPVILDNDMLVVSTVRQPCNGDVVIVRARHPDPAYGPVCGYVWRFQSHRAGTFVIKDNPKYGREPRPIRREEIVGVVMRVIHRQFRDCHESHVAVQKIIGLYRSCKWGRPPSDLGFYRDAKLAELRAVLNVPDSELVDGRVPWGLLRASTTTDHPHADITTSDILTIEIAAETHVGLALIVRNESGETLIGTMERDGLTTPEPGEFYLQVGDRRVALTRKRGSIHLWRSLAVIRRVQRHVEACDARQVVHVSGYTTREGKVIAPTVRPLPSNANQKWQPRSSSSRRDLTSFNLRSRKQPW